MGTIKVSKLNAYAITGKHPEGVSIDKLVGHAVVGTYDDCISFSKLNTYAVLGAVEPHSTGLSLSKLITYAVLSTEGFGGDSTSWYDDSTEGEDSTSYDDSTGGGDSTGVDSVSYGHRIYTHGWFDYPDTTSTSNETIFYISLGGWWQDIEWVAPAELNIIRTYQSKTIYDWNPNESGDITGNDLKFLEGHWPKFFYNKSKQVLAKFEEKTSTNEKFISTQSSIEQDITELDEYVVDKIEETTGNPPDTFGFYEMRLYLREKFLDILKKYNDSRKDYK